ncbi:MAG TPA: tetratricopeptide repeat protein [Candidatus Eisenbacteria bacterium]|jgi:tetratricopeptide (TPR) repeat protein
MSRFLALGLAAMLVGCSRLVVLHDALTAAEHNDLGVAYEAAGDAAAAEREYRRALEREPGFVRAWVNRGNLLAARQRWRPAERCYRRALLLAPADADARNNLAVALLRLGRDLDQAEWLARSAVALAGARDSIPRATLAEVRSSLRPRP